MTDKKQATNNETSTPIKISEQVLVVEKEYKNDQVHKDLITGIQNLNDQEFLTCGIEQVLKVWDKDEQTCDYTIETHKPLYSMAVTGEKGDMLIASLGEGDLIVFGLTHKNQLEIVENAHQATVIQIVSLSKLKNKYFATRCLLGHVNIWSATNHPDRLFTIEHIDKDESYMHDATINNSKDGDQQEQMNTMSGLTASSKDQMIELKWKPLIPNSSTVLCFSNYNESKVFIAVIDLKTRRKNIIKTFENVRKPTYLCQIDFWGLLIGTEGGYIEYWNIESEQQEATYEAHLGSEQGISSIIELKTQSDLLWASIPSENRAQEQKRLIATAALGQPEFRVWVFDKESNKLCPHIKIETSFTQGIQYLLETRDTQIVAVDPHKTLKFYDFIDKNAKEEEEKQAKEVERITQLIKDIFAKHDKDKTGKLDKEETKKFIAEFWAAQGYTSLDDSYHDYIFDYIDKDKTGKISKYEMRQYIDLMKQYYKV